jgi:ABC-type glycerol-3-phosphate transport system substrate-binding protein
MLRSPNVADYDTNYLTGYLEEKTGLDLKFQLFASTSSNANTQFELMVSSNEKLPDIMHNGAFPDWAAYGDNGVFIDLAPYFEKYACFYNLSSGTLSRGL